MPDQPPYDNQPLSEQYYRVGMEWSDANAAATLLEDTKSAVLAERIQAHTDLPYNRAEALVKSSPEWRDHIEKTVAARKRANRLKVQMEYIHIRCWEQNSREATARTEMRMVT